jgi:hypothetical protein
VDFGIIYCKPSGRNVNLLLANTTAVFKYLAIIITLIRLCAVTYLNFGTEIFLIGTGFWNYRS